MIRKSLLVIPLLAICFVMCRDDAPTGETVEPAAKTKRKTESQFITSLYFDVLGQKISPTDLNTIAAGMRSSGDSVAVRKILVRTLVNSPETRIPDRYTVGNYSTFVQDTFMKLLGRSPTTEELSTFAHALTYDPFFDTTGVYEAICLSNEYLHY